MSSSYSSVGLLATSMALIPATFAEPSVWYPAVKSAYLEPISISAKSSAVNDYKVGLRPVEDMYLQSFYTKLVSNQIEPESALLDVIDDNFDELLCISD